MKSINHNTKVLSGIVISTIVVFLMTAMISSASDVHAVVCKSGSSSSLSSASGASCATS